MKIFQTIQKTLSAMGFAPNQQKNNHRKANITQIVDVIFCSNDVILIGLYILREANSIETYMDSIFTFTAVVGITISYMHIVFKNDKVFDTIEFCENQLNNGMGAI